LFGDAHPLPNVIGRRRRRSAMLRHGLANGGLHGTNLPQV
jgi:hypothetical protein